MGKLWEKFNKHVGTVHDFRDIYLFLFGCPVGFVRING